MKEFLLSMVSPLKMKKYRFMSVFITLLIFVTSVYFIALPHQVYVKNHREKFLAASSYVNTYMNLPEDDLGEAFIKARYRTEIGEVTINGKKQQTPVLKSDLTDRKVTSYGYTVEKTDKDGNTKNIKMYIAVDINNSIYNSLIDIQKAYDELYKDDSDTKKSAAGYLVYVDMLRTTEPTNEEWKRAKYEEIHGLTEDEIKERMSKLTNFDLFNITDYDRDTYMIMFFDTYLNSQIPVVENEGKENEKVTYPAMQVAYDTFKVSFDFTEVKTLKEFGDAFQDIMFKPLYNQEKTGYLLQIVGYVLIFPAIYALLLFWCMKKRGVMKTYKEYYNMAGIASIIPLIITFILSWFVPNVIILYGALFCVATLFVYIKINSTPEQLAE